MFVQWLYANMQFSGWVCTATIYRMQTQIVDTSVFFPNILYKWSKDDVDSLVQDCGNSSANALELLQSCTKPSTACFGANALELP